MIFVGIDVAKDKHDCFIISSEGEVLADVFTITNSKEGFEYLLQTINTCTGIGESPAKAKILSGEVKLLKSPISAIIIAPIRRLMPGIVVIGESILSIID